ncbi:hypothetical protein PFISCL1PPCAC_226, partial [Pristionchus fissidentatus]
PPRGQRRFNIDYERCYANKHTENYYRCFLPVMCRGDGKNNFELITTEVKRECDCGISMRALSRKLIEIEVQFNDTKKG